MDNYGRITIEEIKEKDILPLTKYIYENMRSIDKKEITALCEDGKKAVRQSIILSDKAYVAKNEKRKPIMIFGFVKKANCIWALGTVFVDLYQKELVKIGMQYINDCKKEYGYMTNWIHEDNTKALRYIKRAGALFTDTCKTEKGDIFIRFEIGGK